MHSKSNNSHHQSHKHRHRHFLKNRKRFNAVIHVTIRPSNNLQNSKITSNPIEYTRTHRHYHARLQDSEGSSQSRKHNQVKDFWLNETDETATTKDYRQKLRKTKNRNCLHRCFAISVLIALVIGLILVVILPIILIKGNNITTTKPNPLLRWNTTGITLFGISGVAGNDSTHLNQPKDVTFVSPNVLYIADSKNNRIQKYVIGDLVATTVAGQSDAIGGSSAIHLNSPSCVRVDSAGGVYVADIDNNRVQLWPNGASFAETIAGNGTTGPTNGANRLVFPYGIDRDTNSGTLYVGDYGNARIMSYASGASSGIIVAGGNHTQLYNPIRVYFDSLSNSLVITNHAAHIIVRWNFGATSWTLLAGDPAGVVGSNSIQLRFPTDAIFDPMGNMYVADKDNHRIQLFMNGQSEGRTIAGITNIFGVNSTLLYQPWSVKLDNQLNLYVADSRNHRIQKFVRY